ncbi:MAG: arsenate reductase ArsC [Polyangiaceae bacterium]
MNTIVFACVHGAGRSQMATAWFNHFADPAKARALAAGSEPASKVHDVVVTAMGEVGMDVSSARPRLLDDALVADAACVITMGCGERCPVTPPHVRRFDWPFDDPKSGSIEEVRRIREAIAARVRAFVTDEGWLR